MNKDEWHILLEYLGTRLAYKYVLRWGGERRHFPQQLPDNYLAEHLRWLIDHAGQDTTAQLCNTIAGEFYISRHTYLQAQHQYIYALWRRGTSYVDIVKKVQRPPYTTRQIREIIDNQRNQKRKRKKQISKRQTRKTKTFAKTQEKKRQKKTPEIPNLLDDY